MYNITSTIRLQELENMKEELNAMFEEDDVDKSIKTAVSIEKYEELMVSYLFNWLINI